MAYQVRCDPGDGGNLRASCSVTSRTIHHQDNHSTQIGNVIIADHFIPTRRPDLVVPQLLQPGEMIVVHNPSMGLAGSTTIPTGVTILPRDRNGPRRLASLPPHIEPTNDLAVLLPSRTQMHCHAASRAVMPMSGIGVRFGFP